MVAVAAGCSGTGPVGRSPAATVNGTDISADRVQGLLDAQARYLESQRESAEGDTTRIDATLDELLGVSPDTFSSTGAADALSAWIEYEIVKGALDRHGEAVTDEDRQQARASLEQQVGGAEALKEVDAELIEYSIDSSAAYAALGRVAAAERSTAGDQEAELEAMYEELRAATPLCLAMILVDDEDAADAALERIRGGESFEAVATDVSTDEQSKANGGYLGCADAERAAQTFGGDYDDVAEGDLVGPLPQDQGGVVILQVRSVDGQSFEEARPQLERQLEETQGDPVGPYLAELVADADITVDPRYGTWNAVEGRVQPPVDPRPTSTTVVDDGLAPAPSPAPAPAGS